jgi:hypothetical protein
VLVRVCEHGGLGLVVDLVLGLSLFFSWCKATGRDVVEQLCPGESHSLKTTCLRSWIWPTCKGVGWRDI